MTEELVRAATFALWRQFARHTPSKFDRRLHRPETHDEAMWRRFSELPESVVDQFQREARAVLNVAENFQA